MTPGMKSSEFGVTVLVIVSALALAVTGSIEGEAALTAITVASSAYGVGRGLAKNQ